MMDVQVECLASKSLASLGTSNKFVISESVSISRHSFLSTQLEELKVTPSLWFMLIEMQQCAELLLNAKHKALWKIHS